MVQFVKSPHEEAEGRDGAMQSARKPIKTAFVPDRPTSGRVIHERREDHLRGKQKVATRWLAHMLEIATRGAEATAPICGRKGGSGPDRPIIYADPPWKFLVHSGSTGAKKSAENHYPTMNLARSSTRLPQ